MLDIERISKRTIDKIWELAEIIDLDVGEHAKLAAHRVNHLPIQPGILEEIENSRAEAVALFEDLAVIAFFDLDIYPARIVKPVLAI